MAERAPNAAATGLRSGERPDLVAHLHRLGGAAAATVEALEEARRLHHAGERVPGAQPVLRGSSLIPLEATNRLLRELALRARELPRHRRAETDAWLAPRLHAALRLTRREAADAATWQLLGGVHPSGSGYVRWRWADEEGAVTPIRLTGRMNQQALARLWWGAELFRDGSDYRPVERAFARFELVNLCLHRPFVRNRAFALAVLDLLAPEGAAPASTDDVGELARRITLVMPTLSVEAATVGTRDDVAAQRRWIAEPPPASFEARPAGPDDGPVPPDARRRAAAIAVHIRDLPRPG